MRRISAAFTIASLATTLACGGDSKGVTNPNANQAGKSMSARIDGTAWTAASVNVNVTNLGITISGANATGQGVGLGFSKSLGTGTQTFGTNAVALGTVSVLTQGWSTVSPTGASGSVTLTTLTANRAVGPFTFTATPFVGGATGNKVVTQGVFDVTF